MLVSGGALVVTKSADIVKWRGSTEQLTGGALELFGGWSSYAAIYRKQLWVNVAVNKIAGATARLPLKVYRRGESRDDARDTPYGELIRRPNKQMDPFTFWVWVRSTLDIYGESFLGKVRDRAGRPVELVPLHPNWMKYHEGEWTVDDGKRRFPIARRDFVWFRFFDPDLPRGLSPLEPLRATLSSEHNERIASDAYYANGARPSMVLKHPGVLSSVQAQKLAAQWSAIHGGADKWGKTAVLEESMDVTVLPQNFVDLQYIESRKLNREEVCAEYDVSPTVLHILDHATYSNITEQNRALYRDTMAPKIGHLEATLEFDLRDGSFGSGEPDFPDDLYAEFLMDEVLRGSFEARAESYKAADFMTIAEKRQKENLPKIEGSDVLLVNAAMVPLDLLGQQPAPQQLALPPKAIDLRALMGRLSRAKTLDDIDPTALAAHGAAILAELDVARSKGETLDQFKARLRALTEA